MTVENSAPFGIHWLDSSYQQTCSPNSPWQKILDELQPVLARRVRQQFNNPQRRQILIQLLGTQFQWEALPNDSDNPYLLNLPYMSEEHRRKLENEAKSWLQIQIFQSAVEKGAVLTNNQDLEKLSYDMKSFLAYTSEIVWKSLEHHLHQVKQRDLIKQKEEKEQRRMEPIGQTKLRYILRQSKDNSKQLTSTAFSVTSRHSETLSNSIVAMLKRDFRRLASVKKTFVGQILPVSLRQLIWTECLLRFEKTSVSDDLSAVELETRRLFAFGVRRGKNELKLTNPSKTSMTNLIESSVIETYSQTRVLHSYLEEHHLRSTIQILNVLYTHEKDYQTHFLYWLLPFQLSYKEELNEEEGIYVLAMHLNLFIRHCFPRENGIFTITGEIMKDLSLDDPEFADHLESISKIESKNSVTEIQPSGENTVQNPHKATSNPIVFLRKWLTEMFVGTLTSNCVLYLWDQFFLSQWNINSIKHATKSILYLLRDRFMSAMTSDELQKVFLDEPALLYTSDVQRAFVHLALKNDEPKLIPAMNRQFYSFKSIDNGCSFFSRQETTYFGIKSIGLSLIVPMSRDLRYEFKYKTLVVEIQVYGNAEKLSVSSTKIVPIIQGQEPSMRNWQKITVNIPDERLILSVKEVRHSLMPPRIQALVLIHQRFDLFTLQTLAYCRFPLYIPQKIGTLDTWNMTFGPVKRALHPGAPPISIDMIPDVPKVFAPDKIGPDSSISLVVFDPKAEES